MPASVPAGLASSGLRRERGWNWNLHRIRLRPYRLACGEIKSVHGDRHLLAIDFNRQIVVIHFFALKRIVRRALNGIGMSSSSARDEISDSVMFVAFVIVNVAREHYDAITGVGLARFHDLCQGLL